MIAFAASSKAVAVWWLFVKLPARWNIQEKDQTKIWTNSKAFLKDVSVQLPGNHWSFETLFIGISPQLQRNEAPGPFEKSLFFQPCYGMSAPEENGRCGCPSFGMMWCHRHTQHNEFGTQWNIRLKCCSGWIAVTSGSITPVGTVKFVFCVHNPCLEHGEIV